MSKVYRMLNVFIIKMQSDAISDVYELAYFDEIVSEAWAWV